MQINNIYLSLGDLFPNDGHQLLKRSAQISGRLPSEQERTPAVTWLKNTCGAVGVGVVLPRSTCGKTACPWGGLAVDFDGS